MSLFNMPHQRLRLLFPPRPCGEGFTFMEILVVISMVAILSSIGGPAVNSFMVGSKLSAEASVLLSDIRLGRYEAIRTQKVHRMELHNLATNSYACKIFLPDVESDPASMDMNDPDNWASILDEEVRELNPEITFSNTGPALIYFRPDGVLVSNWAPGQSGTPIFPASISLVLEPATMTIFITSGGIMTSEVYYEEY